MQRPHSLGIIGHGNFGRFLEMLARQFAPDIAIRIYDRRHTSEDTRFFTLDDACDCDVVIIAVSISAFEEVIGRAIPALKPGAVLIEVSTVKVHPAKLLRRHADTVRYITTHPMFGPYSFEKQGGSLSGLRIVLSDNTLGAAELATVTSWLSQLGLEVIAMTPEEHDRMLAQTLFLTHYIAQAVSRGGFVRTDIDTLSFGYLMDAVESVRADTELFRDVFAFNPYCAETITRFGEAEQDVLALLVKSSTHT